MLASFFERERKVRARFTAGRATKSGGKKQNLDAKLLFFFLLYFYIWRLRHSSLLFGLTKLLNKCRGETFYIFDFWSFVSTSEVTWSQVKCDSCEGERCVTGEKKSKRKHFYTTALFTVEAVRASVFCSRVLQHVDSWHRDWNCQPSCNMLVFGQNLQWKVAVVVL